MAYKMEDPADAAAVARAREAFADRNEAFNELRSARVDQAAARLQNVAAQTDIEEAAAARALEYGNWDDHARHQRRLSELAVARADAERAKNYFESQPVYERDPVEALIQSKSSEPETVAWLRAHPADALALATNSDPRRAAKIQAAHHAALGEGHAAGTKDYFRVVENYLGGGGSSSGGNARQSGQRTVHVVRRGQAASGEDQLTPGEYRAATEDVLWGREGGDKCGTPIGPAEYLRRRNIMRKQTGWFDKLD
jgi:hypothetical protein